MTTPLESMRKTAASYAELRDKLAELLQSMQGAIAVVESAAMPEILRVSKRIAALDDELRAAIQAHPECFDKPRSVVVNGLKFGLQKQKGRLEWLSDEALCDRMLDLAADGAITTDQLDMLMVTQMKPLAAGLNQLDARILRRLGVSIVDDADVPIVKTVDGNVEKLIGALIRQATKNTGEVAA